MGSFWTAKHTPNPVSDRQLFSAKGRDRPFAIRRAAQAPQPA